MFVIILRALPWLMKAAPLLGLLKSNAKVLGLVVSIAVPLGMGIYINMLKKDISELEGQGILYESQLDQAAEVNLGNVDTIGKLRDANQSLADAVRVTDEVLTRATNEAILRTAHANQRTENALLELEELRNANPTCEQVANIDLGAACPLVTERLRKAADEAASQD